MAPVRDSSRFDAFCNETNAVAEYIHEINKEHGFWNKPMNFGEKLALIHSEISEALESHRKEGFEEVDSHLGVGYCAVGMELADAVIRIMDLCDHIGVDLGNYIVAKMMYNAERPYKHGEKRY